MLLREASSSYGRRNDRPNCGAVHVQLAIWIMTKQYGPKRKRSEFPLLEDPYEDFPTFNNNTVENLSDFISAKVTTAIPVTHPAIREALIVLSLDPTVRSIDYVASAVVASEHINLAPSSSSATTDAFC